MSLYQRIEDAARQLAIRQCRPTHIVMPWGDVNFLREEVRARFEQDILLSDGSYRYAGMKIVPRGGRPEVQWRLGDDETTTQQVEPIPPEPMKLKEFMERHTADTLYVDPKTREAGWRVVEVHGTRYVPLLDVYVQCAERLRDFVRYEDRGPGYRKLVEYMSALRRHITPLPEPVHITQEEAKADVYVGAGCSSGTDLVLYLNIEDRHIRVDIDDELLKKMVEEGMRRKELVEKGG